MTAIHKELIFEGEIVGHLTTSGWLQGDSKNYDRKLALYPEDVLGWIKDTQPAEYEKVKSAQNGATDTQLLERLAKTLEAEGPLAVLRRGFKRMNARFEMCVFKPGHGLNPTTLENYDKVRCRVVRQVRYSEHNQNSIDLVLFVNGIPVATLELKTDFTQSIKDATKQYQFDRLPKEAKTGKSEPLLTFNRGAIVHFAVSTDEVRMTTRLDGPKTRYLPFNLGNDGAAGNPPNPLGHRTSYLWERVLERGAWLEILEKFVHLEKTSKIIDGKKTTVESMVFPRYHQWDAVRSLVSAAKSEGPGQKYLVQHSAGSGKSNTIMWLAHQLTSAHSVTDKKVFNSVIVVTDRNVLDEQLQATISQFEHADGVVKRITSEGAKSAQLTEALRTNTPIVIVTIQTFPFALDAIGDIPDLAHRTFAVIADEAHSSQTGEAAKKLRESLGVAGEKMDGESGEVSAEDALLAQIKKRAGAKNISYFAFTATPKAKTMELFGRKGHDGLPHPFHLYSMQQAIEEGFILDVLRNYTTYEVAYKLATTDAKDGLRVVPTNEAAKLIKTFAKLHPYDISQKVQIIVEHFRETVRPQLDGKAKAMVVCSSRKAAVRYKLAINKYIAAKGYDLAALVAFSGEVNDETDGVNQKYTETGMNGLKGESTPTAFGGAGYQVLIVAEKYQTGFDQPLLVAMYVDKRLSGIAAVQTLSRLNRTYEAGGVRKTNTYVLDFENVAAAILESFKPYYRVAEMSDTTEPDIIHDLQSVLDKAGVYTFGDVDRFFEALTKAKSVKDGNTSQGLLKAALDPVVDKYRAWVEKSSESGDTEESERAKLFRRDIAQYVKAYDFLSQIYDYGDTELEKRSLFFARLAPLLRDDSDETRIDISNLALTHRRATQTFSGKLSLMGNEKVLLDPPNEIGSGKAYVKQYGPLEEVIRVMNEILGAAFTESDVVLLATAASKLTEIESLRPQAQHNSFDKFRDESGVRNISEEFLVEAGSEIKAKNAQQNQAIGDTLQRLFGDPSAIATITDALARYAYDYHKRQSSTDHA